MCIEWHGLCVTGVCVTGVCVAGVCVWLLHPGGGKNPFAKSVMSSPSKRDREPSVLDKLVGASPQQKKLVRQSTFAMEGG